MNKLTSFVFILVVGTTLSTVYAANGFCNRCNKIREERMKNPPKEYQYYEDYLNENGGKDKAISRYNDDMDEEADDDEGPQRHPLKRNR